MTHVLELTALCATGVTDDGVILNISSMSGPDPPTRISAFTASQATRDAATRAPELDLGPRGLRVLGIAPGPVERPEAPHPDELRENIRRKTALPRFATPQDVAHLAAVPLSDKAGFLTAETIGLHGVWH